jgi:hypothetical protein
MDAVVEEAGVGDVGQEIRAPAALLPPGIQEPINIVDGRHELILPSDHTYITDCAEQCFLQLAETKRFFRQGSVMVELVECSEGPKLVELTVEAFRSRLESHFTLRSLVALRGGGLALRQKLCSQDNAKALLATEAALKYLPPIQATPNSPVLAEDEAGTLTVLNQGYHASSGGIYVLGKRNIDTTIETSTAVKELLSILEDFSFLSESDKSRCVAGLISPALRFGRLLDTDFPLDLCEADKSQTGKSFRMKVISKIYGERPFVVVLPSESKKGVGSLDESLSEALLSGQPFIVLENVRGQIASQLLESAIRGEGKVSVRRAYSRTTLIDTDHVYWMTTSNQAQMTQDLANRSIITRLRKRPFAAPFKEYPEGNLLKHVEVLSDYYLSCIFAVIREWHAHGKCRTQEHRHDFREWSQALDWIIQKIFKLPPLLEGHRAEQLRISSVGLSFLREIALMVQLFDMCNEPLTATELAFYCDARDIEVPGCRPGADLPDISKRIGSVLGPLFRESDSIEVEGFVVSRTVKDVYNAERQENRETKSYVFERRGQ